MVEVSLGDFARLVDRMLGGTAAQDLGPHQHRHVLPETEEEIAAAPLAPSFTVEELPPSQSVFGTYVAPVPLFPVTNKPQEIPEAFRRRNL